ncbi:MAG: deoxyribodipyrimidine photo-lyase [Phycisphaeraceae bacterium]|nr:deoxyribodipyrimidine photo-lyase [Phycisphaeraceae bacterium]
MRPIVWFRSDLRTRDNPALSAATRVADRGVVAVFLIAAKQWREHDCSPARVDFVLRTLAELSTSLRRLNVPLRILHAPRFADATRVLLSLAREQSCDALYFNRELEVNEVRRDEAVSTAFERAGLRVAAHDDATLLPPGSVRTREGRFHRVYSPFRRAFAAEYARRGGVSLATTPRGQEAMPCPPDDAPGPIAEFGATTRPDLWPAGEQAARRRLAAFIEKRIAQYHTQRDEPGADGTSALSPYLAAGVLSARECLLAALEADGSPLAPAPVRSRGPAVWIDELIWREFFRHLIVACPRLCMGSSFNRAYDAVRWNPPDERFEAWRDGRTGVPIVDAAMRQLASTGWMHNRCRMIVASFLTKNLLIDWRHGERHFMRTLIDGDLAANNGGWQWAASTGADAAPYFRVFNPVSQARRFDADGMYVRRFVPELASLPAPTIHEPWALPPLQRQALDYPEPIIDLAASRRQAIEAFAAARDRPPSR